MIPQTFNKTGYVKPIKVPEQLASFTPEQTAALPTSFITDIAPFKEIQNVFMQSQEPSCVAHGVTVAIMYHYWKQTGKYIQLSPRFVYALCKTIDGIPAEDGTYIQAALEIVQKYGVCEDKYFPNDCNLDVATYTNASLIPPEAFQNALQYKIDGYSFLADTSATGLNTAIYNEGKGDMVIVGMDISDTWWTDNNGNTTWSADSLLPLRPIDAQHPEVSGHCINWYAYGAEWDSQSPSCWWNINWWSAEWAYQGRGCFTSNDLPNIYEAATIQASFVNTSVTPVDNLEAQPNTILVEVEKITEEAVAEIKEVI